MNNWSKKILPKGGIFSISRFVTLSKGDHFFFYGKSDSKDSVTICFINIQLSIQSSGNQFEAREVEL
jgi:hypothetical protein